VELDNLNLIRAGNVNNAQSQASGIKPRSLPAATPIFRLIDANPRYLFKRNDAVAATFAPRDFENKQGV